MDNRPIGVMDSGAGGLTAARVLKARYPKETMVYFGDSARNPYGERPREEIVRLAEEGKRFLLSQNVKAVVIACNTITFNVPPAFYEETVPVVGMSLDFSQLPRVSRVAVFATPASIATHRHKEGVLRALPGAAVVEVPCEGLAGAVERVAPREEIRELVQKLTDQYRANGAEAIIFGCTHYPLIRDVFEEIFPGAFLLDPAEKTVEEAMRILAEKDALSEAAGEDAYWFSGDTAAPQKLLSAVMGAGAVAKKLAVSSE